MTEFEHQFHPAATRETGTPRRFLSRRSFLRLWAIASFGFSSLGFLDACMPPSSPTLVPAGPFDPDNEPDAVNYSQLTATLGAVPNAGKSYRVGVVVKFLGNPYWQLLSEGIQSRADQYGMAIDIQGASTEADQANQLAITEAMIARNYDALLISPQTDENLTTAVEKARQAGILVINVNDAVIRDATHWVGPNQYENGVRAARYFIQQQPAGGQVAVIEGQPGVYAARQRTLGFKDTLAGTNFEVVASVAGEWDLQKSLDLATGLIQQYPHLKGFYCNNDIMALGVVEAVNKAGRSGQIMVIGTDGIEPAYDSIRAGGLTATVASFPYLTGQVAVEVALRLLAGQPVPRAVFSPQNLVTLDNIDSSLTDQAATE